MQKQMKQLLLLIVILLLAVGGYVFATHLHEKETTESAQDTNSYDVTLIQQDSVKKLEFTNDSGTHAFQKDGENWISEEDTSLDINETILNGMVSTLAPLKSADRIENVEDLSQFGLDNPSRKLTISDGNTSVTILVGAVNEAISKYYICLENDQKTVYTMDTYNVTSFDKTLEDCVVQPATTEATTE